MNGPVGFRPSWWRIYLYFFSEPNDLVLFPMAGGGVCADTCFAMGRRCWSLDIMDDRPEIEPWFWDPEQECEHAPLILDLSGKPEPGHCQP